MVQEKGKPEPLFVENGNSSEWIWKGFGEAGFLEETIENGKVYKSATELLPFAVNYAKELGVGPVILVDVSASQAPAGPGKEKEAKYHQILATAIEAKGSEAEQADLVLRPSIQIQGQELGYFEFEKKSAAIFEGEQAVIQRLGEIKKLCGKDLN